MNNPAENHCGAREVNHPVAGAVILEQDEQYQCDRHIFDRVGLCTPGDLQFLVTPVTHTDSMLSS